MGMTRKDYEAVADAFKKQISLYSADSSAMGETPYLVGARDGIKYAADRLAVVFERENTNFDSNRFLKACGV